MSLLEEMLGREPVKNHKDLRAFAAGWDAFCAVYGGMLIAHGHRDFRPGLVEQWEKFKSGPIIEMEGIAQP